MALQINKSIATKSGFTVPSGSYVWLFIEMGLERKYVIQVRLQFFKSKADFDAGRAIFDPSIQDIPDTKKYFSQEFTPQVYGDITALAIEQYVQAELTSILGANMVTIVP